MPSFDIVSEIDLQEVRNAVDQASRELSSRFDFRGVDASVLLEDEIILVSAPEEFQINQIRDILRDKMTSRKIDSRALQPGLIEGAGKVKRQKLELNQGISQDISKKITKLIKESKLKVQSQINGEKLRVTGKKRDELQSVMSLVKDADLPLPMQFNNFRD